MPVAVVPGRDPPFVLLLQFVPQCEEGGVGFDAAVERVWAGKPCLLHESCAFHKLYKQTFLYWPNDTSMIK